MPRRSKGTAREGRRRRHGVQEAPTERRSGKSDRRLDAVRPPQPQDQPVDAKSLGEAVRLLDTWIALEVLSPPQPYNQPEDLAAGDTHKLARIGDGPLPWERPGEPAVPRKRLYYQVVLGEVDLPAAYGALLARFADPSPEPPPSKRRTPLVVVVCDQHGRLAADSIAVASFGWAVPIALGEDLPALGRWRAEEARLRDELANELRAEDPERALTQGDLERGWAWLVATLRLPRSMVHPPSFALREYQYASIREPPDPLLLNSFFLGDLLRARDAASKGALPPLLARFLGASRPREQRDVLRNPEVLADLLAPHDTPPGRWPGPGRAPLVTLQQAAVNLSARTAPGELVAVNGPPGTGKTTLLRDIVAAVITARAEVLASFDDPERAFELSDVGFSRNGAEFRLRRLAPRLRGFELVVASSNNKAVENVSDELPGIGAIASDLPELRYFASLATQLRGRESWGLVAAVLGNSANRYEFQQAFWVNEDSGMESYLAVAAGTPRKITAPDGTSRAPRIVERESPPAGRSEALARYRIARERFQAALATSKAQIAKLQHAHELQQKVVRLRALVEKARREDAVSRDAAIAVQTQLDEAKETLASARARLTALEAERRKIKQRQPALLGRLFPSAAARPWVAERDRNSAHLAAARQERDVATAKLQEAQRAYAAAARRRVELERSLKRDTAALAAAEPALPGAAAELGAPTAAQLLSASHDERHLSTAWFGPGAQRVRDELFVASVALHRAFIDAAAVPVRHNLAGLMRELWMGVGGADAELVRDLWATFFLVVPLVSTTFASVENMFQRLRPSSLGWLLIDEAGQAPPQAAVGALMRSQRAVVVGDPMQVEPVVMLPESLTAAIAGSFGVQHARPVAPAASVQTFADGASPIVATFESRGGSRAVGVPLLVHRRCSEPMFGISNAIAYENLMVQAKVARDSAIGAVIGPSRWFHVEGIATSHWCPEEGVLVVRALRKLVGTLGGLPDLYVVTPFRAVADAARQEIRRAQVVSDGRALSRFVQERVGTIHTVQGREAEAVIFVLGAPDPRQQGARDWAGRHPNLLNVAVTRAKERLYVIGNRQLWRSAGCFRLLDQRLPQ